MLRCRCNRSDWDGPCWFSKARNVTHSWSGGWNPGHIRSILRLSTVGMTQCSYLELNCTIERMLPEPRSTQPTLQHYLV